MQHRQHVDRRDAENILYLQQYIDHFGTWHQDSPHIKFDHNSSEAKTSQGLARECTGTLSKRGKAKPSYQPLHQIKCKNDYLVHALNTLEGFSGGFASVLCLLVEAVPLVLQPVSFFQQSLLLPWRHVTSHDHQFILSTMNEHITIFSNRQLSLPHQ